MKLLIAGLATGLACAAAPVWADNERGNGWRNGSVQQVRHWDDRGQRYRHYQPRHHNRHWQKPHERYDRHHYRHAPRLRHQHYYYRDYYSYQYPGAYSSAPSVWFSWSID